MSIENILAPDHIDEFDLIGNDVPISIPENECIDNPDIPNPSSVPPPDLESQASEFLKELFNKSTPLITKKELLMKY